MAMNRTPLIAMALASVLAFAACSNANFNRELGASIDEGRFGNPTMNNLQVMTGQLDAQTALATRFANEVNATITFEFNSAVLSEQARATLAQQATWIRQFPEVTFRVYGHTDLVGSDSYNKALGLKRARAAVAYLTAQGIGGARLEAVASFGKTRPVVQTPGPEEKNRRTVTEVSGFVKGNPTVLNGKYAEIIWRDYVASAQPGTATESEAPAAAAP